MERAGLSKKNTRKASHPRVAVMILNRNGLRWLKLSLPSVLKSTCSNLEMHVIDNDSTDGSAEFVERNFPSVRLIRFEQNLGFAEAYNRAIKQTAAEYVLLLNNDTEVLNSDWITLLVNRIEQDPHTVAVGCKLVTMNDHERLDSVGGMGIKYWRGFVDIGKFEVDSTQYDNPPVTPFSACGAAMLVRRSAFEDVGGFDSRFYAYLEDVDLCWRLRLLGYNITYEPAARVAHYFSGTWGFKDVDDKKLYISHRNLMRAIMKNCGSSLSWALRDYLLFSFIAAAGFCFLEPMKTISIMRGIAWNLRRLRETYAQRLRIQKARTRSEKEILARMYPGFPRYEPAKDVNLRRILNILFEYRIDKSVRKLPSTM